MVKKKVVKTTITEETIITDEKTQIVCILDTSASMSNIIEEARGGFNKFLKDQKELPDEATITIIVFDNLYELIYDNIDIKKAKELTSKEWSPRGMTALYDAIGKGINDVKATHKQMKKKDRPDKVLVCIVTDGDENSSREFTQEKVKELISSCEKDGWNFVFLAANQDAFEVGTSFGICGGNTINFTADMAGMANVSATLDNATTFYRSNSTMSKSYIDGVDSLMDDHGVGDDSKEN